MANRRLVLFGVARGALAILVALFVAAVFIFIKSATPWMALRHLLVSPVLSIRGTFDADSFFSILAVMIPTIFTGLGVAVMFSANQFNLGGEGAAMAGGFAASLVAIYMPMASGLHPVVAVVLGALVAGVVTFIPGLLKEMCGASEMVSSLMLNYVVMYLILYLLNDHLADRTQGMTQTYPFAPTARIAPLVGGGSKLTVGFLVALVVAGFVGVLMARTRFGYQVRMIGKNRHFAHYTGMHVVSTVLIAQALGGVLSGAGGAIEVLGRYDTFFWKELPGFGWTGITIAILARNNPFAVPLAAFFIAYLNKGCEIMSTRADIPSEMIAVIQASVFLFFAAERFLAGWRQRIVVKSAAEEARHEAVQGDVV